MTTPSPSDISPEEHLDSMLNEIEEKLKRSDSKEYEAYRSLTRNEKLEYIKVNWVKLATAVDRDCLQMMGRLIHPLLRNTLSPQGIDEINKGFTPGLSKKIILVGEFHSVMIRLLAKSPDLTPKEKISLILPSYLMLFEGPYRAEVDFLVYLLILSGRSYYRTGRSGKIPTVIKTYEEIEDEPIRQKLLFIEAEGFTSVAASADRDLRNAIAHLDYSLSNEGVLSYDRRDSQESENSDYDTLDGKFSQLYSMVLCVNRSIRDFYEEWVKEQLAKLPEGVRSLAASYLGFHEENEP